MKICNVNGCNQEHEAKGYCQSHLENYEKYGVAVGTKAPPKIEVDLTARNTVRWAMTREGTCNVEGCSNPRKSRGLCEAHYARQRRRGTTDLKPNPGGKLNTVVDTCLVIECDNEHYQNGYCSTHVKNNQELKTPYRTKIIKLCGVKSCESPHLARGLCKKHYHKWQLIQKKYGLEWRE